MDILTRNPNHHIAGKNLKMDIRWNQALSVIAHGLKIRIEFDSIKKKKKKSLNIIRSKQINIKSLHYIISVPAEITLLKSTCHFLLLLVGIDILTYRKNYFSNNLSLLKL